MTTYLSLVPSVIRLWSILLGFACFGLIYGQKPLQDSSNTMEKKAKELLAREIHYANTQTLLSESLRELAQQSQINIVFSESTLGTSTTKTIPKAKRSLQQILELLLADTWFDYLVIGQTVAIVTATKHDHKPTTDSTKTSISRHIVTSTSYSFDHIPARERRQMRKLLLQELDNHQLKIVEKNDTTFVVPQSYPQHKIYAQVGLPIYTIQYRSQDTKAWKNNLSYKSHARLNLSARSGIEVHREKYYVSAGIAFQKLDLEATWIDSSDIPPADPPTPAPAAKPKYKDALDQYFIVSIPIVAGYPFRYRKHTISPTLGLSYSYVRYDKRSPKKFEKYYKQKNAAAKYAEQSYRHLLSASIGLSHAYEISDKWGFKTNLEYNFFMNPIASNSLFKTLPHYLSLHLGMVYLLD